MRSHFKRHNLDISFIKLDEETPHSHPAYEIRGEYAKRIFSQNFCLTEKECDDFKELATKDDEDAHRIIRNEARVEEIENLLSIYPTLMKSAKQKKKNTRLAMYLTKNLEK